MSYPTVSIQTLKIKHCDCSVGGDTYLQGWFAIRIREEELNAHACTYTHILTHAHTKVARSRCWFFCH